MPIPIVLGLQCSKGSAQVGLVDKRTGYLPRMRATFYLLVENISVRCLSLHDYVRTSFWSSFSRLLTFSRILSKRIWNRIWNVNTQHCQQVRFSFIILISWGHPRRWSSELSRRTLWYINEVFRTTYLSVPSVYTLCIIFTSLRSYSTISTTVLFYLYNLVYSFL